MQIENHTLKLEDGREYELPRLPRPAKVHVWQVPEIYREKGLFVCVQQESLPMEIPACEPWSVSFLGSLSLDADHHSLLVFQREERLKKTLMDLSEIRWQKETGGITVGGMEILTDRESQSQLANAYSSLREGFLFNTRWKSVNGWQTVDTETLEPIARAVALHTAACFVAEEAAEVVLRGMTLEEMKEVDVRALFLEKLVSLEEQQGF